MSDAEQPDRLSELLTHIVESTDGDRVSMGDMLDTLHNRSYGPLLLLPAVIQFSPLGGIPGMPIVTGGIIFLLAAQMLFATRRPWLPGRLKQFSFGREKLTRVVDKVNPWIRWFEKAIHHRMSVLAENPVALLIPLVSLIGAVLIVLLGWIPFAAAVPSGAILLLALGLTARDGLLIVLGYLASAGAGWLAWYWWPF